MANVINLVRKNPWRAAASAVLLVDAALLIYGLLTQCPWFVYVEGGKLRLTAPAAVNVILWTIGPPAWFFLETYTLDDNLLPSEDHATKPKLKAEYERLRLAHDLASKVWAAVLAAILFSIPKG